jgi:hypothetical protein
MQVKIDVWELKGSNVCDRFTVCISYGKNRYWYGMSDDAIAFNQFCGEDTRVENKYRGLGKKISFHSLSKGLQRAIVQRLAD